MNCDLGDCQADQSVSILKCQRLAGRLQRDRGRLVRLSNGNAQWTDNGNGFEDRLGAVRASGVDKVHEQLAMIPSDTDVDVG